jgi:F420-non-reducing hydrogenase small subunit
VIAPGDFTPRLVALLCEHCAYVAADRAGAAHLECPPEVRLVRVPCTGRVDAELVLHALDRGADGVVVMGCHPGDCHFDGQNLRALQRHRLLGRLLEAAGVAPARCRLAWVSASEPERFAAELATAVAEVRALGPSSPGKALSQLSPTNQAPEAAPEESKIATAATPEPGTHATRER